MERRGEVRWAAADICWYSSAGRPWAAVFCATSCCGGLDQISETPAWEAAAVVDDGGEIDDESGVGVGGMGRRGEERRNNSLRGAVGESNQPVR